MSAKDRGRSSDSVDAAELKRVGGVWVPGFEGRYVYNKKRKLLYYVSVTARKLLPKAPNTGSIEAWTLNKEAHSYGTYNHDQLVNLIGGQCDWHDAKPVVQNATASASATSTVERKYIVIAYDLDGQPLPIMDDDRDLSISEAEAIAFEKAVEPNVSVAVIVVPVKRVVPYTVTRIENM